MFCGVENEHSHDPDDFFYLVCYKGFNFLEPFSFGLLNLIILYKDIGKLCCLCDWDCVCFLGLCWSLFANFVSFVKI